MPDLVIAIAPGHYARLVDALAGPTERVVFLAAQPLPDRAELAVSDLYIVGPDDVASATDDHVALSEAAIGDVIRWAHDRSATLLEAHAHHGRWPARFSWTDLDGLRDWVPHVRWRLVNRPYGALVFGDASYDGLVWAGDERTPKTIGGLRVGDRLLCPTGLTMRPSSHENAAS